MPFGLRHIRVIPKSVYEISLKDGKSPRKKVFQKNFFLATALIIHTNSCKKPHQRRYFAHVPTRRKKEKIMTTAHKDFIPFTEAFEMADIYGQALLCLLNRFQIKVLESSDELQISETDLVDVIISLTPQGRQEEGPLRGDGLLIKKGPPYLAQ